MRRAPAAHPRRPPRPAARPAGAHAGQARAAAPPPPPPPPHPPASRGAGDVCGRARRSGRNSVHRKISASFADLQRIQPQCAALRAGWAGGGPGWAAAAGPCGYQLPGGRGRRAFWPLSRRLCALMAAVGQQPGRGNFHYKNLGGMLRGRSIKRRCRAGSCMQWAHARRRPRARQRQTAPAAHQTADVRQPGSCHCQLHRKFLCDKRVVGAEYRCTAAAAGLKTGRCRSTHCKSMLLTCWPNLHALRALGNLQPCMQRPR